MNHALSPSRKAPTVLTSSRAGRSLIDPSSADQPNDVCRRCHQSLRSGHSNESSFEATLRKLFPGAGGLEAFVFATKQTLVPKGFLPHVNTLVCVGLCRDEITSRFEEEIEAMWGQAFICGSLGGMLFCGNTGFSAAHHHAPDDGRFVYYCFTHIAIDQHGTVGAVYRTRSGMTNSSAACGALVAFTAEIASGKVNLQLDENDIEMSMLKRQICKHSDLLADAKNRPDLYRVTMAAYQTITNDLERQVRLDAEDFKERQYALFTGVQIHGPNGIDYCWLGKASLFSRGVFTPITLVSGKINPQQS